MEDSDDTQNEHCEHKSWSRTTLRTEFRQEDLESLFDLYVQKIQHGYFSLFLILQIILSTSHITVLLLTNMKYFEAIFADVVCYCVVAVLSLIALFLKETIGKTCAIFPLGITLFTILALVTCDLFVPLYHSSYSLLRPAYTTHAIMACYVFLPIPDNLQAFVFGFAVTLCHLIMLAMVTYRKTSDFAYRLGCDAIYMLCINGIGLYFRYMNEILKRRTFLDRRACVQSTLYLKHEEDQEEQLMLSILPQHIAKCVREDIKNTLQNLKMNVIPEYKPFRELYIKKHDDVTILYADIVRYTEMTRTLPVIELVKTLNELFSKFDDASEDHDVLRIKFLGDCYYCVSGVPESNPNHAISCVDLGLDMIAIIQEVRRKRNLNIDMRIGVHSGSIFGGLIGECKWQYDIWSKDVDIANRMEQRGKPGKVHITKQTLNLLQNRYNYAKSDAAAEDEFLRKLQIETFLIIPDEETPRFSSARMSSTSNIYSRRQSASVNRTYNRQVTTRTHSSTDSQTVMSHRRTAFMNHNIKQYNLRLKEIDNKLEEAVNSMPLRKFEQWFKSPVMNPFLLTFRNWKMEFPYFMLPDPMFKYYLISSFMILVAILGIQILSSLQFDLSVWLICITLSVLLVILMPLAWLQTFFRRIQNSKKVFHIQNFCYDLFKGSSVLITSNVAVRIIVYFVVSGLIAACTVLDLVECEDYINDNNMTIINKSELYCAIPWHLTHSCSLAILASFLFLRIHLGLKLVVGSAITLIFSYLISNLKLIDEETWNRELKPQIACIMSITFLTFTLHLIDRQAEYLNRLDYQWQNQLTLEQKEAQTMHGINNLLLQNILPVHVVQKYLDTNRPMDELYHEQYKSVAVMFASVVGYEFNEEEIDAAVETSTIVIMNDIISEFDKLLIKPCGQKIEKIKVAGWTYMAACGLDPGRKDSTNSINQQLGKNIVLQLVTFGINMMKVLDEINGQYNCEFKLRIGISHGEVTAGVIGSKKPLYDIWGNAVNMASRMDSTGEKGKIQVTDNTAQVLIKQGIKCNYRGDTYIKGLDTKIPTFFVGLDSITLDLNNDR